tara:strand:- start:364 stop:504 length:141 start_codon:yes stop_codon:yes gene_type:complete
MVVIQYFQQLRPQVVVKPVVKMLIQVDLELMVVLVVEMDTEEVKED